MLTDAGERARAQHVLVEEAHAGGRLGVVYHADADGISAAALAIAAFERLGGSVVALTPSKGESVYDDEFRHELERADASAALIVDTGSRAGTAWREVPTVIVDHHPTSAAPDVEAFVHDPDAVATSALVLSLVEDVAPVGDRAWLAAVGALGDRGDDARREPYVMDAVARFGISSLREVVSLVNASGRTAEPAPNVALDALRYADDPRELVRGERGLRLDGMRAEVREAVRRARKVAPRVRGRWAIIELDEPCRIHGVIASAWARRLAPQIVLVANRGYMPGRVHLSVRAHEEIDLRAALRALVPDAGHDYAAGHARASGAIVDGAIYARMLAAIDVEAGGR